MIQENAKIKTKCVHAGNDICNSNNAVNTPIYMTSNYTIDMTSNQTIDMNLLDTNDFELPLFYQRDKSINQWVLEKKIAFVCGTEDCLVLASGTSALSGTFLTFLHKNEHAIVSKVSYQSTRTSIQKLIGGHFDIDVDLVDTTDITQVEAAIKPNTRLIHIETPGNPTTELSDLEAIATLAHQHGILVSVDATFASPICLNPFDFGADLVIHSMTKYINGHGDALGGCIAGKKDLIEQLRESALVNYGGVLSPFNAWLVARGMATLPLRMKQHCDSAMALATYLESKPYVKYVRYPGLKSHPQHDLAKKIMTGGFSGMLCFGLKNGMSAEMQFMNSLKMTVNAASLGDTETLITYLGDFYPPVVENLSDPYRHGLLRVSTGLEDVEDIIADFQNAFKACGLE